MITPNYCLRMARHNRWQNSVMMAELADLSAEARARDRGAFFGSIEATANHLIWGDLIWLSRFDGGEGPQVPPQDHTKSAAGFADWCQQRQALDARFLTWAHGLSAADLQGEVSWHSAAEGRQVTADKWVCILQMFNHQTHHRGQIHAMVTAAGGRGWTTDLPFMPEEFASA